MSTDNTRPIIPTELVEPIFYPHTFGDRAKVSAIFDRLRHDYPLAVAEVPGFDPHWIVTKYKDLREITRQDAIFHNADRSKTVASKFAEQMMRDYSGGKPHIFETLVHMDEPKHMEYRSVTADAFMPQNVAKFEALVREKAKKWVDKLAGMGPEVDFATNVAFLYPLEVVMTLLGIPEEDHPMMLRLTQWLFTYADPDLKRPGADLTKPEEHINTWNITYNEFRDYFLKVIADRRANPRADVSSLIANGKVFGGDMDERAMISYLIIASTAGHDTTSATTAWSMWEVAKNPELLQQLKANPALVRGFIEESIRWAAPVQHFIRSATQDYELSGKKIREGDLLYLSYLSANRDEDIFKDPHNFDPKRSPNPHIGFGYGSHICLGQHLARLELNIFWQELLPRLESVELIGPGKMAESEFVAGPKSVPIRFKMA